MKQGIRRSLSVLAMALLLTGILAACGTDSEEAKPTVTREVVEGAPPTRTATLPADATPEEPAGETSPAPGTDAGPSDLPTTFEIDMVDLAFEPTTLTIPANTDVTINAVNKGALPHTFTIPDVADTGEVAGGSSAQVVVNLPPGEYDFHCAVPGHLEAGMVGTLTVVEGGAATAASPEGAASPETAGTPAETPEEEPAGAAATTVEVDMVDLAFQPAEITVPADTDVTINAVNKGALPHTFTIPDVADTGEVAAGDSASVTINLPPGEYAFDCAVPGHKEAGMVGTLIVVAGDGATEGAAVAPSPDTAETPAVSEGEGAAAALPTTYKVDMVDLAFNPTEFTIPADTDVTINLVNSGALPHSFDVESFASGEIPGGATGSVVVNLPAGTYEYWCAVPGHKEAGMVGTLTVVAAGAEASPEASPVGSPVASPVAVAPVNLDMVELAFKPGTFEIPANTDVTINLSNSGNLPHNFTIKDQDVSVDLAAGEKTSFTLNLPAGTYDFICDVPGHEAAGMVGTLTVVEGAVSTPVADAGDGAATSAEVDMVDIAFNPTEITIAANTDVTITAVNSGVLPHTFTITDVADTGEVLAGDSASVTVNLAPGEYKFICAVPGHEAAGMVGTLIVK